MRWLLILACVSASARIAAADSIPSVQALNPANLSPTMIGGSLSGSPPDDPSKHVDPNTTGSRFGGVVAVTGSGGTFGSGVALDAYHILSAQHVTGGTGSGLATVVVNYGSDSSQTLTGTITVQPTPPGNAFPYNDLSIITLSAPLDPQVPVYPLYRQPLLSRTTIIFAGYGYAGSGDSTSTIASNPNVKRFGSNVVDLLSPNSAPDAQGRLSTAYIFDFDNGLTGSNGYLGGASLGNDVESSFYFGDSGGPSFIDDGGVLKVFGVNSFILNFYGAPGGPDPFDDTLTPGPDPPLWGSGGGGEVVFPYLDWIDSIVPVPEPTVLLLPALSLAAAFRMWRRVCRS